MTAPIPPVAPPTFPTVGLSRAPATPSVGEIPTTQAANPATGFADAVTDALGTLGRLDNAVTEAGQRAATGDLNSVSDYMIATSEAQLATEITVAIRDRAIAAFHDIIIMQI
ncbi:MAG: flagellar hook-basal body complex protein FliE [Acidimicrobiales bacterium]